MPGMSSRSRPKGDEICGILTANVETLSADPSQAEQPTAATIASSGTASG